MKTITNTFGAGILYEENDLGFNIYTVCTACMSIWSDFLSFGNCNKERKITNVFHKKQTDTIVILGCQVTDLAIYNDLRTAHKIHKKYPDIPIYMGGCLAQRFDIELPDYLKRLDVLRKEYNELLDLSMIKYQKPFWNPKLSSDASELEIGNLFRHMYPLKIGAGCHGKCKYCTIRHTRGNAYETDAYIQIKEFLNHADEGVVLISDSPTMNQIKDWCHIATRYEKSISFRNVEPRIANICQSELLELADNGLLRILHCPIQSGNKEVLEAMNRNVGETFTFIEISQELRKRGVIIATNIIIDYKIKGVVNHNMNEEWLNAHFDYWSWNPYFDGIWDYNMAEKRYKKYIGK